MTLPRSFEGRTRVERPRWPRVLGLSFSFDGSRLRQVEGLRPKVGVSGNTDEIQVGSRRGFLQVLRFRHGALRPHRPSEFSFGKVSNPRFGGKFRQAWACRVSLCSKTKEQVYACESRATKKHVQLGFLHSNLGSVV